MQTSLNQHIMPSNQQKDFLMEPCAKQTICIVLGFLSLMLVLWAFVCILTSCSQMPALSDVKLKVEENKSENGQTTHLDQSIEIDTNLDHAHLDTKSSQQIQKA